MKRRSFFGCCCSAWSSTSFTMNRRSRKRLGGSRTARSTRSCRWFRCSRCQKSSRCASVRSESCARPDSFQWRDSIAAPVQSLLCCGSDRDGEEKIAMKCSDLMKTDVECCDADESIVFVAERMRLRNVGFVPVCNAAGAVVGTITDRDLVVRVLANELDGAD